MSGLRFNPILGLSIVALIGVVFVGMIMLWQGRNGQMRDSEADFQAKMRSNAAQSTSPSKFLAGNKAGHTQAPTASTSDAELAAWYAEADKPAEGEAAGSQPPADLDQP